ncbi:hypothetical protein [Propionimicrobium lymphophilum]|uniref:hypothetical protein n=1 Tax=Propionimicrobium lymphophilum TaxID=33012 RepID=UPI001E3C52E5|nr:hypothetical protein [Propionimicrobium lymphophilum]MDK7710251.1 hypothetical protein [Propionimicrobium lymphophilum]
MKLRDCACTDNLGQPLPEPFNIFSIGDDNYDSAARFYSRGNRLDKTSDPVIF